MKSIKLVIRILLKPTVNYSIANNTTETWKRGVPYSCPVAIRHIRVMRTAASSVAVSRDENETTVRVVTKLRRYGEYCEQNLVS